MYKDVFLRIKHTIENYKVNGLYPIHYYNFWKDQQAKDIWFSRFIEHHELIKNYRGRINFYSVLGPPTNLEKLKSGINIFFSGENMHADRFKDFRLLSQRKNFDLYIDFDSTLNEKSIRFPLWLLYTFKPDSSNNDIKKKIDQLRFPLMDNHVGFGSMVASHDWNGIRGEIFDKLSEIDIISSGGRFRKNTDDLNVLHANIKNSFIRNYKFNICPENSNTPGYVTEKIFQSIEAGCIPIYWGSDNKPEIDILNQDAILFWNKDGDNSEVNHKVMRLHNDSDYFRKFFEQPRLLPQAEEKIIEMFDGLKKEISDIIDRR